MGLGPWMHRWLCGCGFGSLDSLGAGVAAALAVVVIVDGSKLWYFTKVLAIITY